MSKTAADGRAEWERAECVHDYAKNGQRVSDGAPVWRCRFCDQLDPAPPIARRSEYIAWEHWRI